MVMDAQIDPQNSVLAMQVARFRHFGARRGPTARILLRIASVCGLRQYERRERNEADAREKQSDPP